MAFSIPCDACRIPLRGHVVTIRVARLAALSGVAGESRLVPAERPHDYLLCPDCATVLDAYVRYLDEHGGVPSRATG